ncbi:MAG TPA: hypothetical protein VJB65_03310, partial [Patescibacteria group bacterium]|nr:hypothetical protein [Patescibacteria group bacterium]
MNNNKKNKKNIEQVPIRPSTLDDVFSRVGATHQHTPQHNILDLRSIVAKKEVQSRRHIPEKSTVQSAAKKKGNQDTAAPRKFLFSQWLKRKG